MNGPMRIDGVPVEATFAEAFDMKATRVVVTAEDRQWALDACRAMTGFGTSVIACGIEIAIERELATEETPDGRPGFAILAFAMSGSELEKQIPRRTGQCVLTCPTTAIYGGITGDATPNPKRVAIGKSLRYFGDGHQISKLIDGTRYWRIPVMDGEFVCEHDVARVDGIGGGNFLLLAESTAAATRACRAAVDAIAPLDGVITPFPGGATRSGSKVGSKYAALFASTNEAFCPGLKHVPGSLIDDRVAAVLEVVIDGLTSDSIAAAMRAGIHAACASGTGNGLVGVTAGNYGGKLGRHHFHLSEVIA